MTTKKQVIVLRMHRTATGDLFPWDCLYFFKRTDEELISRIFNTAWVLEMSDAFINKLKQTLAFCTQCAYMGDDKVFPHKRIDEARLKQQLEKNPPLQSVMASPKEYVAVVPTLHLKRNWRECEGVGPIYLSSHKKLRYTAVPIISSVNVQVLQKMEQSNSYYLMHGEKIQPICLRCKNVLDGLTGKCSFGEFSCYSGFAREDEGIFVQTLNNPQFEDEAIDQEFFDA